MRWRFTDKAVSFAPWESIAIVKAGSLEEYGLLERFGESGLSPASLVLESCVQAARWLVEASSSFAVSADLLEVDFWRVMPGLTPGERLYASLRVEARHAGSVRFAAYQHRAAPGEAFFAEVLTPDGAREPDGVFSMAFSPLAERYLPGDRACLWGELLSCGAEGL